MNENDRLVGILAEMQACLDEMLKVLTDPPPRQVSISDLQRDDKGQIIGANIGAKPQ